MSIEILHCDCMDYMKQCDDDTFDLAIVDPPYGINSGKNKNRLNSGSGKLKNRALNKLQCDWDNNKPTKQYFDELFRISKNQIIFGSNYFALPPTRCVVCWDKMQPWENFSQIELAWTSFDKPAKIFKNKSNDVQKIHPTQKPIKLYQWIIEKFSSAGERIIDTHLGSGSSAIAAHYFGCDFVGCELNKHYYEAALKRYNDETSQQAMNL